MEGYIGEIRMFAGNFSPKNWAFCHGQTLNIQANSALFSILGTTYGGNGVTTFGLPDLRGRVPVGVGTGPGLSEISLGQIDGTATITLLATNIPGHSHALGSDAKIAVTSAAGDETTPVNNFLAAGANKFKASAGTNQYLGNTLSGNTGSAGGSQPFNNRSPYLGMNYIVCQFGVFPSRN